MPFYRYTAQDASGKTVSGALDATSPDLAYQRLSGMGLGSVWVEGAAPGTATTPRSAAPAAPHPAAPRPAAAPSTRAANSRSAPSSVTSSPRAANPPRTMTPPQTANPPVQALGHERATVADDSVHVPIAGAKERAFFFDQLGRFINSGIAPSNALERLGVQRGGREGEFLRHASGKAGHGIGIGESLRGGYITEPERAALTAAERGGYVPQACARLSDLALDAHRLGRGYMYPLFLLCFALFTGPCTMATQDAALRSIERQDKAGGTLAPIGTVREEMGRALPMAFLQGAAILFLVWAVFKLWNLPANRRLRHRLPLAIWPLAPRARSEGTAQLASHLAALSSAAIPTHEATRLAAATIPNLVLREEAIGVLGSIPIGSPFSAALARSNLVSTQYKHLVANGELTGDVPGALGQIARVEEGEFTNRSHFAKKGLGVILLLVAAIVIVVIVAHAETAWYSRFIEAMLKTD